MSQERTNGGILEQVFGKALYTRAITLTKCKVFRSVTLFFICICLKKEKLRVLSKFQEKRPIAVLQHRMGIRCDYNCWIAIVGLQKGDYNSLGILRLHWDYKKGWSDYKTHRWDYVGLG